MNMDTGNTFIAGPGPGGVSGAVHGPGEPRPRQRRLRSLAAATRGKQTGIAVSHCALGDGVNAENIKKCLALLRDRGYDGVLSIECEGQGGPMIERSLKWLRDTLAELKIRVEA